MSGIANKALARSFPGRFGRMVLKAIDGKHMVFMGRASQYRRILSDSPLPLTCSCETANFLFSSFKEPEAETCIHAVAPLFGRCAIDRDSFWKQRIDLMTYFARMGVHLNASQLIRIATEACVQVNGRAKGVGAYYDTLLENTQRLFNRAADKYAAGKVYDPSENLLGSADYSHIGLFAWIYYIESRLISSILRENGKGLNVFEFGSSFGNPIFTKHHLIREYDVHYCGVDKRRDLLSVAEKYALRNSIEGVFFFRLDLASLGWQQRMQSRVSGISIDIITASHLLEHMPSAPVRIVEEWLRMARKAVVISVPHTEEKADISGHMHHFNAEKLDELAQEITLTHGDVEADLSNIDSGILMLKKSN